MFCANTLLFFSLYKKNIVLEIRYTCATLCNRTPLNSYHLAFYINQQKSIALFTPPTHMRGVCKCYAISLANSPVTMASPKLSKVPTITYSVFTSPSLPSPFMRNIDFAATKKPIAVY